jgi:hypothetical protein
MLIQAIDQLADGVVSQETVAFLHSLDRPLCVPNDEKKVLFAHNVTADIYNMQQLSMLPGEECHYLSEDKGNHEALAKIKIPKVLMSQILSSAHPVRRITINQI